MKLKFNGIFLTGVMTIFIAFFELAECHAGTKRESQNECENQNIAVDGIEDGAEYFFYNKAYLRARLAQWGGNIATQANSEYDLNQLWVVESRPDGPQNYFTIRNVKYPNFRLAKWGSSNREFGVYDGNYYLDQFWKFEKVGKYYRIYNHRFPSDKITKLSANDDDVGTYSGSNNDNQLWNLVPRYKAASVNSVIFSFNNQGSSNITKSISVTVGVINNIGSSLTSTLGFKTSVSASIKGIVDVSADFKAELSSAVSRSVTNSFSKTKEIKFHIPPRVNYEVRQENVNFKSHISSGNFQFHSLYEVKEKPIK